MTLKISQRLLDMVDKLPLNDGMRILEIGCGPGVAAREICARTKSGYVLGIDRSAKAITQAISGSLEEISAGRLEFKQVAIEDFIPEAGQPSFDLLFAIRVGALDGRHPNTGIKAMKNIAKLLKPEGQLFIDGILVPHHPLAD